MTAPFKVDHHWMGVWLKWPDGLEGEVGALTTSSSVGVIDPRVYPHIEQAAAAGRARASMVLYRRPNKAAPVYSWHVRTIDDLTGRILAKPRKKETHHA